jgi:hypothetical protein
MIGSLSKMVVLVAIGNSTIKDGQSIQDFDQHAAFKFYEWTHFRSVKDDAIFAHSPSEYLNGLRTRGVRGLLVTYGANSSLPEGVGERTSAGFVGGGKQYLIQEFTDLSVNYLALQSELGDRDREDQKIWRDTFHLYHTIPRQLVRPDRPDLEWSTNNLAKALEAAISLCDKDTQWLKTSNWPELFRTALRMLEGDTQIATPAYMNFPYQVLSERQNRLLLAGDRAWVFGGMGSWNDIGFQDEQLHAEYEAVSERLYKAVNMAITDAVNAASPVFDLSVLKTPLPTPPGGKPWWKFW